MFVRTTEDRMSRPKLCVTVTAATTAELCARRDQVVHADLIELRLDSVRDPDAAAALAGRRTPVLVTCRPTWEGGGFTGTEAERLSVLHEAVRAGAEYVDVEWRASHAELIRQSAGRGVVVSMHDFSGVPDDLGGMARAMRATGAEVIKLAVTAHSLSDSVPLLDLAAQDEGQKVLLAMGEAGFPTRVLADRFGSAWTYAGDGVASGQVSAARLRGEFGFGGIGAETKIYGVLGRPVSHSLSPAMHNAAFRATGIDGVYLPLAASTFDDFRAFADRMDIAGVSVTAPFKIQAFELASQCDAAGHQTHAINTLRREGGRWHGRNTDVDGFLAPLRGVVDLSSARVTVLGAGGAARAAALALASAGAAVTIAARRRPQARAVAELTGASVGDFPPLPGRWDVLVNATSVGTAPDVDESPLPADHPLDGTLVYDLVYNPQTTRLLADAARAGCRTLGGLDMLVAQAQAQFEWWTGQRPADHVMRAAALARLEATEPR